MDELIGNEFVPGNNIFSSEEIISDPEKKLLGQGNQYRYILVKTKSEFPKSYIKKLLKDAYANSMAKVKDRKQIMKGKTIVKSISEKKRGVASRKRKTKK